jgi:predicted PhzF superfamily epimerase YddE/YHI9
MFETSIVKKNEIITFSSKAGILKIHYIDGWVVMNFPAYDLEPVQITKDICNYIVITPAELYRTAHGWTFVLLRNEEEVLKLSPDFKALKNSEFGDMIVTAPSSDPRYDHCALVPFWNKKTGRKEFTSHQVSKRGGILKVSLNGDRVEIAGQAQTIFRAELLV